MVILLAGLTQGLTGFGYALVSVPLLAVFLPLKTVIPLVLIHGTFINLIILYESRKSVNLKWILPLIIAGAIGMPFGTHLLIVLDQNLLKVIIGVVIVLFSVALLKGYSKKITNEKTAFIPVGLASGLLTGSIAIGGPPVILFFTNQRVNKQVFRANLVAYFIALNAVTIPFFAYKGLVTTATANYTFIFLPAMLIGSVTGIKLAGRIQEQSFRKTALIIVVVAGIISIASGLGINLLSPIFGEQQ